ncbi:MAG: glycosyltransferase family 2 protein [Patescibacteria group bacterium]|jgi:glycosyltransferase involved in cell wall biosynthesis
MPHLSVIIPTWNRAHTISQAIQSVLNQTYTNLEVLVCDDGSTDNTETIVKALAETDSRIYWLPGKHSGKPAIVRNCGLKFSTSPWVAFLDSDDYWLPKKIEQQFFLLERFHCRAACTNALSVKPKEQIERVFFRELKEKITFQDLLIGNGVICSSALVHRSVFETIGLFPEVDALGTLEDYAFWLRVATQTDFVYCAKPQLVYRDNPQDSIRAHDLEQWVQRKIIFKDFLHWNQQQRKKQPSIKKYSTAARWRFWKEIYTHLHDKLK